MTALVVAYVDRGCPHRRASFEWTQRYWWTLYPSAISDAIVSSPDPFTRPSAINQAVAESDADVFLQADPDSVVSTAAARRALRLAADAHGLVVAFSEYLYLTRDATADVLTRQYVPGGPVTMLDCETRGEGGVGNIVAFSRRTWEQAGGFDERFDGAWGGCDGAFAYATGALVAPIRRVTGPMLHLWHPRQPESEPGHPEYLRQFSLVSRYRDAADDPAAMRVLVSERRG